MDDLLMMLFMAAVASEDLREDLVLSDMCDCSKCPAADTCDNKDKMAEKRRELESARKLADR